jgi:hypothetical protein
LSFAGFGLDGLGVEIGEVDRRHSSRSRRPVVESFHAKAVERHASPSIQPDFEHVHFTEGARRPGEALGAGVY